MTGRAWQALTLCLAIAALAACGLKGDPRPPRPGEGTAPVPTIATQAATDATTL